MLGTGCLQQNNPTETPRFPRRVVPMAGMLQLITYTELPGKAAIIAGRTWPVGTRLPVKGTLQPVGDFPCSAHAAAGRGVGFEKRIWEGIGRGDAALTASVQSLEPQSLLLKA